MTLRELPLPVMAWALGLPSAGEETIQAEHQKVFFCVFFPAISDDIFLSDFTCIIGIGVFCFFYNFEMEFSWNGFILRISDVYRKY